MNQVITQKLEGKTTFNNGRIAIETSNGMIDLPGKLTDKLVRRMGVGNDPIQLEQALREKSYYARGEKSTDQIKWFGVVSERFSPINACDIQKTLQTQGFSEIQEINYNKNRLTFHVPLSTSVRKMYAFIDLGRYGTLGGDGESAVKYGISWFNEICTNWTLFLHKQAGIKGKIIHQKENNYDLETRVLEDKLAALSTFAQQVEEKIEESKTIHVEQEILLGYVELYSSRINKKLGEAIIEAGNQKKTLYDMTYAMTLFSQTLTKTRLAQAQIDMLAGELLLQYPLIHTTVVEYQIKKSENSLLEKGT